MKNAERLNGIYMIYDPFQNTSTNSISVDLIELITVLLGTNTKPDA